MPPRAQHHEWKGSWDHDSTYYTLRLERGWRRDKCDSVRVMVERKKELRKFAKDEEVYVENFTKRNPRWIPGTIIKITGPLSYEIQRRNKSVETRWPREKEGSSNVLRAGHRHGSLGCTGWTYCNTRGEHPSRRWQLSSTRGKSACCVNLPCRPPVVVPPSIGQPSQTFRRSTRNRPPPLRYGKMELRM